MNPPLFVRVLALAAARDARGLPDARGQAAHDRADRRDPQGPRGSAPALDHGLLACAALHGHAAARLRRRDVTMLTEEITDETKKLNAGTRDMLISSVSDMSRRSRAVRLVAFGKDTLNVVASSLRRRPRSAYQAIPQYDIKGSVSQFDENLIKNQKDLGFGISPFLNLGVATRRGLQHAGARPERADDQRHGLAAGRHLAQFGGDPEARQRLRRRRRVSQVRHQLQHEPGPLRRPVAGAARAGRTGGGGTHRQADQDPLLDLPGRADPKANEETKLEMFDWYHSMAATRIELIA